MKYLTLLLFPVLLLCTMPAKAEKGFAIGGRFGTLGAGFEITKALTKRSRLRFGANAFTFNTSFSEVGIRYDGDIRSRNAAVIFDYHPLNGRFRVSAGVFYNKNEIDADASGNLSIGGNNYNTSLNANVSFDRTSPYIGIGWGNAVKEGNRLTHSFDLGLMYQGSPKVELSASNPAVSQADLNQEALQLEDALSSFRYYPVISYGISFKF